MAQTGYTPIQLYRTTTAAATPLAANLIAGELAINYNTADMSVWALNTGGSVVRLMNNPAGLKYPTTDGTINQVLKTDGAGLLSWVTTVLSGGALGTPTSGTLTNCTGLSISSGVSGLAANVATFLQTPSSANLAAALTDETGTGANVFASNPTFPAQITLSNNSGYNIYASGTADNYLAGNLSVGTTSKPQPLTVYGANGSGFTGERIINGNGGTGIAGVEFVSDPTYSKAAIGLLRNNVNGVGNLNFYNSTSTSAADWTTADLKLSLSSLGRLSLSNGTDSICLQISSPLTGGISAYGVYQANTISSAVTSAAYGYFNQPSVAASATLGDIRHYFASQGTFGAGASAVNQYGFFSDSSLTGAVNNFGFYGGIASGTGRYNLYMAGTADNYLAGSTTISVTDNTNAALRITQAGTGNALVVQDSANPDSTPFVIDGVGNVFIGQTTAAIPATPDAVNITNNTVTVAQNLLGMQYAGTNAIPPEINIYKTRGTVASKTVVASNDALGVMQMWGYDGTNYIRATRIEAQVDGTPGTNDMPGRLVFSTTADGASIPTERVRIDSSGNVGIGTASPNASAILDAQSTTKGVRFPNMTTTQKLAIATPAAGLVVFDTTSSKLCVYTGAAWQTITSI